MCICSERLNKYSLVFFGLYITRLKIICSQAKLNCGDHVDVQNGVYS